MSRITPDVATREGLATVLAVVREAAREAAALVHEGYRRQPHVDHEHKGAVDLVTEYDRMSESLVRRRLAAALPFAIVGEEEGGSDADVAFYVDPIDGTTNFVHGHPFWCVSVGLVAAGTPILGVVVAPPLGSEWFGWIAANGERLAVRRLAENALLGGLPPSVVREVPSKVSTQDVFEEALLATGFPYDRRTSLDDNFSAFVAIKRRCRAVRRCGSAALDLCLVADGTYDGYWERKVRPWDIAAGAAIVRAAGGRVTDFDDGPAFLESGRVVATNGAIHERLLTEVANARAPSDPGA